MQMSIGVEMAVMTETIREHISRQWVWNWFLAHLKSLELRQQVSHIVANG